MIWSRGRSPEFGGIESPRIWGPVWVPQQAWQERARGHDLARPPGALPNLLCAEGPGLVPGEEPGRWGAGRGKILGQFLPMTQALASLVSLGVTDEYNQSIVAAVFPAPLLWVTFNCHLSGYPVKWAWL